jgi:signal transduction histidine kinase
VNLEMPSEFDRMKPEVETAIFRIVQESLTNIHRHSGAQGAHVSLETDGTLVKLSISDDGRGISQDALARIAAGQSGVGVTGMRERVTRLGGTFQIHSELRGAHIRVAIPLR